MKDYLPNRSVFYLVFGKCDLSSLEAQHHFCVFCSDMTVLCDLFDLFRQVPERENINLNQYNLWKKTDAH